MLNFVLNYKTQDNETNKYYFIRTYSFNFD